MKLGRIMGVVLSFLAVMYIANKSITTDFSLAKDNSIEVSNDVAYLENTNFDRNNSKGIEVIEYVNKYNYPIEISENSISITCEGVGNTRLDDEELVKNNFEINTYFSKELNGKKEKSLVINKKEKIYIHVITKYVGEKFPNSEVKCDYNIEILSA